MIFDENLIASFGKIRIIAFCLIVFSINAFGQTENKPPTDLSTLKKVSAEELAIKTQAHDELWGISKISRWDIVQDQGDLVFTLPDGLKAVAPAQIIGTYNSRDRTWLWAWANPSINESLTKDAQKVREFGEKHKIELFTNRKWVGGEEDAWAMAAIAVKLCGAQGAYRGPASDTLFVFMTFGKVTLSKR